VSTTPNRASLEEEAKRIVRGVKNTFHGYQLEPGERRLYDDDATAAIMELVAKGQEYELKLIRDRAALSAGNCIAPKSLINHIDSRLRPPDSKETTK
jgi:hypothetical protein